MSILVVGLSHHTAPLSVLEQISSVPDVGAQISERAVRGENVAELVTIATCNRVELYVDARTFHGAVSELGEVLAQMAGIPLESLHEHLYVHYEDRAVAHLFRVACGLESMAVGEAQILAQIKAALADAREAGQTGPVMESLFQHALRTGRKAHADTDLDQVSRSLVGAGLAAAERELGDLSGLRVLVVGAGAMSALSAATVSRAGVASMSVVNRTRATAERLAGDYGGTVIDWSDLGSALGDHDLVVTCTGSQDAVITAEAAMSAAVHHGGRQLYIDLAMPRDVAEEVAGLPRVQVLGLAELGEIIRSERGGTAEDALTSVQDLVVGEVAAYLTGRRVQEVGPTVAALRSRAADVVAAEMERLDARLPDLGEKERAELKHTVHRVVEKLLHAPTVRVKELAGVGGASDYAAALRELFDLDPRDLATVSKPPRGTSGGGA